MKSFILVMTILVSTSALSKTLTVDCSSKNGKSLAMVSTIANINTPQAINSLVVNGLEVKSFRDVSSMPIYKDGSIKLKIQFGKSLFSSALIDVTSCNDDFLATGKATMSEYVGGFAGTVPAYLDCSCSLK